MAQRHGVAERRVFARRRGGRLKLRVRGARIIADPDDDTDAAVERIVALTREHRSDPRGGAPVR